MPVFAVELRRTGNIATIGQITAATASLRRGKLTDIVIGADDVAADTSFINQIQRVTTVGTGTAIVPAPVDPADSACGSVATNLITIDPTYTAATVLLSMAMNQRTTMHWIAPPGGELVWPAVNLNGLGIRQRAASAITYTANAQFIE